MIWWVLAGVTFALFGFAIAVVIAYVWVTVRENR